MVDGGRGVVVVEMGGQCVHRRPLSHPVARSSPSSRMFLSRSTCLTTPPPSSTSWVTGTTDSPPLKPPPRTISFHHRARLCGGYLRPCPRAEEWPPEAVEAVQSSIGIISL